MNRKVQAILRQWGGMDKLTVKFYGEDLSGSAKKTSSILPKKHGKLILD